MNYGWTNSKKIETVHCNCGFGELFRLTVLQSLFCCLIFLGRHICLTQSSDLTFTRNFEFLSFLANKDTRLALHGKFSVTKLARPLLGEKSVS